MVASLPFLRSMTKSLCACQAVGVPRHSPPGPPLCTPGLQLDIFRVAHDSSLIPHCSCVAKGFSRLSEAMWPLTHFPMILITKTWASKEAPPLSRGREERCLSLDRRPRGLAHLHCTDFLQTKGMSYVPFTLGLQTALAARIHLRMSISGGKAQRDWVPSQGCTDTPSLRRRQPNFNPCP